MATFAYYQHRGWVGQKNSQKPAYVIFEWALNPRDNFLYKISKSNDNLLAHFGSVEEIMRSQSHLK
jgi:hypothetical protein